MKRYVFVLLILSLLSCKSEKIDYNEIHEEMNRIVETISYKSIFIFDELSCAICMDNVLGEIHNENGEFIILYLTKHLNRFNFENSLLSGFISNEKVISINNSLLIKLRNQTKTYKGNYKVELSNGQISSIKNF